MSVLDNAVGLWQAKNYTGTGDFLDESGNSHDGTITGATFKAYNATDGAYAYFPGVSGNHVTLADSVPLSVTGDIDIRTRIAAADYTPAATDQIVSKVTNTGGYEFSIKATTGVLNLTWWETDGTLRTQSSTVAPTVTDGDILWIRCTLDVDNGSSEYDLTFYTGGSAATPVWVQLGDVVTGATGVSSIRGQGDLLSLASRANGTSNLFTGAIYEVQIYSDLTETTKVVDVNFADAAEPFVTFTERSTNAATVTINTSGTAAQTVIVDRSMFIFDATNDEISVTDHADLDFAETVPLTVVAWYRPRLVAAVNMVIVAKKDDLTTSAGYILYDATTVAAFRFADGTENPQDTKGTLAAHTSLILAGVRNITDDDAEVFIDGAGSGTPTTDSTTATLANALPLRFGATSGTAGTFFGGELFAVALWRQALTDAEINIAGLALQSPTQPFTLHGDALMAWILANDTLTVTDTELVGALNELNSTTGAGYAEARGTYLGIPPAG